jgi:hypothetical protein
MALICCPECDARLSDRADECPKCGCPLRQRRRPRDEDYPERRPRKRRTFVWVLVLFGLLGLGLCIGVINKERQKTALEEADRLWSAGIRDEAVSKYKEGFPAATSDQKPAVVKRIVEQQLAKGDLKNARTWVEKGLDGKMTVAYETAPAKELLAQVQRERLERESEARRKKEERAAERNRRDRALEVWATSHKFVEDALRSPGTASYGRQKAEECVVDLGNDVYLVQGWVDAQNAFGAKVRTDFEMKVRRNPGGKIYTLVEEPKFAPR